jgi:hypothetical protein
MRCQAEQPIHPTATHEERQCANEASQFFFEGSYGKRYLCDSHAENYRKAGFKVDK